MGGVRLRKITLGQRSDERCFNVMFDVQMSVVSTLCLLTLDIQNLCYLFLLTFL